MWVFFFICQHSVWILSLWAIPMIWFFEIFQFPILPLHFFFLTWSWTLLKLSWEIKEWVCKCSWFSCWWEYLCSAICCRFTDLQVMVLLIVIFVSMCIEVELCMIPSWYQLDQMQIPVKFCVWAKIEHYLNCLCLKLTLYLLMVRITSLVQEAKCS